MTKGLVWLDCDRKLTPVTGTLRPPTAPRYRHPGHRGVGDCVSFCCLTSTEARRPVRDGDEWEKRDRRV